MYKLTESLRLPVVDEPSLALAGRALVAGTTVAAAPDMVKVYILHCRLSAGHFPNSSGIGGEWWEGQREARQKKAEWSDYKSPTLTRHVWTLQKGRGPQGSRTTTAWGKGRCASNVLREIG